MEVEEAGVRGREQSRAPAREVAADDLDDHEGEGQGTCEEQLLGNLRVALAMCEGGHTEACTGPENDRAKYGLRVVCSMRTCT